MIHRGQELHWPPKKWKFCAVAVDEMMACSVVDPQENEGVANIAPEIMILRQDGNCPCLDMSELKQQ